jgi:hypothetical protein
MKKLAFSFAFIFSIFSQSSSQICSATMPEIKTSFDTSHMRGLADNYYLWDTGQKIYVKFLNGSLELQNKIKNIAKEWERYANVSFVFISTGNAHVRIYLNSKGGHYSLIGTMANTVGISERTMHYDTTKLTEEVVLKRTVLHEFGHALGLLHEHFSPLSGISWNKDSVYSDLSNAMGWDKETVDLNIFQQYKLSYTNGTVYDEMSIMEYPIQPNWTTNGYSVGWNSELSEGDKTLVRALYPFSSERKNEVPRISINTVGSLEVRNSRVKNGLLIYPKFKISTAGKEGHVYFIVYFYDSNGLPIVNDTDEYSVGKTLATFRSFILAPGKKFQVNKDVHDFELFIPYSAFALEKGKNNIKAKFTALLYDNNEIKLLATSNPVNCFIEK